MTVKPHFYGLEPNCWGANRLFKVFVSDQVLCGAYVAGQFYDERAIELQLRDLTAFLGGWIRRLSRERQTRETHYDALDLDGDEFLAADRRNFRIERIRVIKTTVRPGPFRIWAPDSIGDVTFELSTGERRRFILIADQDLRQVVTMLRVFQPDLVADGCEVVKPDPAETKGRSGTYYRVHSWLFTACAVLFTICACLTVGDPANQLMFALVAVVNLVFAGILATKAAKHRRAADDDANTMLR